MKKQVKVFIIVALTLVLGIILVACNANASHENDEYYTYTFKNVRMVQKGINTYDFSFDVDSLEQDIKVYLTERDHIRNSDVAIPAVATAGEESTHFEFTASMQLSQGYFLWVKGEKEAVLPITAPSMFPKIVPPQGNNKQYQYDFSFTPGVSWSCFCDPVGRALYVSDKDTFDDTATPIMTEGRITEQEYPLNEYDASKYYYSVITAKNGLLTIISSPVMAADTLSSQLSSLNVNIQLVENKPILQVRAELNKGELLSSEAKDLELLVKNDTGDEIYSSKAMFNGEDNSVSMSFDCSLLLIEGKWYDLALAYKGSLVMDIPESAGSSGSVLSGEYSYSLRSYEGALKVTYDFHVDISEVFDGSYLRTAELVEQDGAPILKITVKLAGAYPGLDLVITAGNEDVLFTADREDKGDGVTVYTVDLSGLTEAGTWYDIKFMIDGNQADLYYLDYMTATELASTKLEIGARTYGFQEYNGDLKVEFTQVDTGTEA